MFFSNQQPAYVAGLHLCTLVSALADQPIFNKLPRWDGGYGFQIVTDTIHRSDLLQDDSVVGAGFSEDITQLHFEGVYTWDRSVRLTFKLPYVLDARREVFGANGEKEVQRDQGIGDLTLALPLKKYFNLDGRSGSWTFAPQVRIPLDNGDDYEVWDHVWGAGLSLGYETETRGWFFGTGVTAWLFETEEPAEISGSIDLGWNFRENAQFTWETDLKFEADGTVFVQAGPALYWRFTDEIHGRVDWKHDFYSKAGGTDLDHGNGDRVSIGVGFVF